MSRKTSFLSGMVLSLLFVAFMFYAGTGYRADLAASDMYAVLCQGLNAVYWGSF